MRIKIGVGEVVSQLGHTNSGVPCVTIEPVREGEQGTSCQGLKYLNSGEAGEDAIVLEIHGIEGAMVLIGTSRSRVAGRSPNGSERRESSLVPPTLGGESTTEGN